MSETPDYINRLQRSVDLKSPHRDRIVSMEDLRSLLVERQQLIDRVARFDAFGATQKAKWDRMPIASVLSLQGERRDIMGLWDMKPGDVIVAYYDKDGRSSAYNQAASPTIVVTTGEK